jgi:hypothetical protein
VIEHDPRRRRRVWVDDVIRLLPADALGLAQVMVERQMDAGYEGKIGRDVVGADFDEAVLTASS